MDQKPEYLQFSAWSTANTGVIRALINHHGGLEVMLYHEAGNPVDRDAISVICSLSEDANTVGEKVLKKVLGGDGSQCMESGEYIGQRIGFISRSETSKPSIANQELAPLPLRASLVIDKTSEQFAHVGGLIVIRPHWPEPPVDTSNPDYLPF